MKSTSEVVPENLCIVPWVHLEATSLGHVQPCCKFIDKITDNDSNPYQLNDTNLKTVWKSQYMNDLREAFKRGEKPSPCKRCWDEESAGITSRRQFENKKFNNHFHKINSEKIDFPVSLDLKLGNICNLKCRICSTVGSSKWRDDEIKLYNNKSQVEIKLKQGNWVKDNQNFWQELSEFLPNIEHIDFAGGEPLLLKEHFEVLKLCVDKGFAKNISLNYSTNGTIYPEEAIKNIWPHFKSVMVMISIDGIKNQFEYQRYPARWNEVQENLLKFSKIKSVGFSMAYTVSALNVFYIPEFDQWAKENNIPYDYNILHKPDYFCIMNLPTTVKDIVTQKIGKIERAQSIIDFMNSSDSKNLISECLQTIESIDSFRKQNYQEVFPEYFKWLEKQRPSSLEENHAD